MEKKIKLMVDSSSDIKQEEVEKYKITMIPIGVTYDEDEYKDRVNLDVDDFYARMRQSDTLPTTAACAPFVFEEAMRRDLEEYDEILYISISSRGSGMFNCADIARKAVLEDMQGKRIEILDSEKFSMVYGYTALVAARAIADGKNMDEVIAAAKKSIEHIDVVFSVGTLEYLFKGGRINRTSLVFGNLLDIRPILSIRDGVIAGIDKVRGSKKIGAKMVKYVNADPNRKHGGDVIIIQGDMAAEAAETKKLCEETFGLKDVPIYRIGPTVGAHVGPDVMGIVYVIK